MTDYIGLKRLAEVYLGNPAGTGGEDGAFRAAANPAAVLALIAENDELRNAGSQLRTFFVDATEQCCKAERERDQIRTEVAGLRTGYEAYERVNAELKADNEALRANSSLVVLLPELDSALEDLEIHGQHSDQGYRKLKDWYRKVDLACKAIDAAMGKGEQS